MSRKENIEKNMEFLIKELQKEWDVSKETKHRVTISVKDAKSGSYQGATADCGYRARCFIISRI